MALTPGVLSKVSVGASSVSLSSAVTGGTTPYSYVWYRSTVTGFTPGTANAISGATAASLSDTGLSPGTQYYYRMKVTDSDATPLIATTAELAVATTQAAQDQNQFAETSLVGLVDLRFNYNTIAVEIDAAQSGSLVAGQAVKVASTLGGIPKVVACSANSDECVGFINFDVKSQSFVAGDRAEISMSGNVMYLNATTAITRGAQVCLDVSSVGGVQASVSGAKIVGWAVDGASVGGVLIRVMLKTPSFTVA